MIAVYVRYVCDLMTICLRSDDWGRIWGILGDATACYQSGHVRSADFWLAVSKMDLDEVRPHATWLQDDCYMVAR